MSNMQLLKTLATVALNGWRNIRADIYSLMKDTAELDLIRERNLQEFSDVVGPTWDYFQQKSGKSDEPAVAKLLLGEFIRSNNSSWTAELRAKRNQIGELGLKYPPELNELSKGSLVFSTTGLADAPFRCEIENQDALIRINLYPDEMLYSLLLSDRKLGDFNTWPDSWTRSRR